MLRFGLIGSGNFGSKIKSKITSLGNLVWTVNSDSDYSSLEKTDWVFIASPNIFHYEQAKFFLNKGSNVFIEKPGTLGSDALYELIQISKKNDKRLYVSDVFLFREDLPDKINSDEHNLFRWGKKESSEKASIFDRFAYHHLYLIYKKINADNPFVSVIDAKYIPNNLLVVNLEIEGYNFLLEYEINDKQTDEHLIYGFEVNKNQDDVDALESMLALVINDEVDINYNHKSALWVLKTIEQIKIECSSKVNVIGAGIFGCTAAIELANRGFRVDLFEQNDDILKEASSINQYRIHRGYHYPRSIETASECKKTASDFCKNYRQAVIKNNTEHYYAISSYDSLTSREEYLSFLDRIGLEYEIVENYPNTSLTVRVIEDLYDPIALKQIIKNRLYGAGVNIRLQTKTLPSDIDDNEFKVIATYSRLNEGLEDPVLTQYELCEKPVLKLPDIYKNKSVVIMDGPFMCIDPFGNTGNHVMGNVVHAIHSSNIGYEPSIPNGFEELLNNGIIRKPKITKIDLFLESAKVFLPEIEKSQYLGSMFTFRAVQPKREHDDARPTVVDTVDLHTTSVFSGKICTCLSAAKRIASIAQETNSKQSV